MPLVSVLVPTMRAGGIDVLFAGLAHQTYPEIQLVLSDGLYKYRRDIVAEQAKLVPFAVKHVEPRANPFPLSAFCRYANEAIAAADGELAVFLVDYTMLPPDAIASHVRHYQSHGVGAGYMLPHEYYDPPALSPKFPGYGNDELETYVHQLENGGLADVMWSIFEEPASAGTVYAKLDSTGYAGADPKLTHPPGWVDPTFFHGKNESVAMAPLRLTGGWNEAYDGSHCYQDSDLAERLKVRAGIWWECGSGPVAQIINPRRIFPFPRRERAIEDNLRIWHEERAKGYPMTTK